jgi:hypothetical protein
MLFSASKCRMEKNKLDFLSVNLMKMKDLDKDVAVRGKFVKNGEY